MKPSEILTRAADLIAPPGKWTQGAYSRDAKGDPFPISSGSVCWCAEGAVAAVAAVSRADPEIMHKSLTLFRKIIETQASIDWNDAPERTQSEVVSALRAAAELAKQQESAA